MYGAEKIGRKIIFKNIEILLLEEGVFLLI
jgi:hypothetical protein